MTRRRPSSSLRSLALTVGLGTALVVACAMADAMAASFPVTKVADTADGACDADCSLREAVIAANDAPGPDVITVPAGTYVLGGAGNEDLAASGDLDVRDSVSITGAGAGVTIVDGGGNDRLIDIVESAVVAIRSLTLRNGHVPDGDTQGGGALLWNEPVSGKSLLLLLDDVVVSGNHAGDGDGGGILIEQDKPASALVTITNSTITGNTMDDGDGGGLHLCCENLTVTITTSTISGNTAVEDPGAAGTNGEGGGIYHCCTDTSLAITDSTVAGNTGPTQGGGIYACCGVASNTLVTLQRTTVSGNTALGTATRQGFGGGIEGEGAVTLVNSTVSGNRAFRDGGGIESEDVLRLQNVTIAENEAARGAGFFENGLATTLSNTLFADNVIAPSTPANCAVAVGTDPLVSEGGNLSSDDTCQLLHASDRASLDPLLEPLVDNGGSTATHGLAADSPAVDGGSDAVCQPLDQRGRPRPADGDNDSNAVCDVGAFERSAEVEDCDNGVDDNGNTRIDCLDFDCAGFAGCAERCDDCVDDDGDGLVDRDDSADCAPRSDAAGAGTSDPAGRGKPIVKCAAAIQKAGAKIGAAHGKTLRACVARLATCVQKKDGDPGCLAKAGTQCAAGLAKLAGVAAKTKAGVLKRCDPLTGDELRAAAGLGFATEQPLCGDRGVPTLATAADVAACLTAQTACTAQRLVAIETPRANALLALGGLSAAAVLPCAETGSEGNAGGLGERGKAADACGQAIQKAGSKLAAGIATLARRCGNAVFACRQQKPADATCLPKAQATCAKAGTALAKLETKTAAAIAKKCDPPALTGAELLGATGVGFQAEAAFCKALGGPTLGSAGAVGECVVRHHRCRAEQLVERELPRLDELLTAGGLTLP